MNATCDSCTGKFCSHGDLSQAPQNCPSLSVSREETLNRYPEKDMPSFLASTILEAEGYGKLTRVQEIMEYAKRCGYEKIGVAFCSGFSNEAKVFCNVLRANGFEVVSVCCKNGAVEKLSIGLTKEQLVQKGETFEAICNPAGQAAVLDTAGCQLSVVLGLCVGHDTLFIKNSKTPITVLATKDRVTGHNALAPLYCSEGYYKKKLFEYKFIK